MTGNHFEFYLHGQGRDRFNHSRIAITRERDKVHLRQLQGRGHVVGYLTLTEDEVASLRKLLA